MEDVGNAPLLNCCHHLKKAIVRIASSGDEHHIGERTSCPLHNNGGVAPGAFYIFGLNSGYRGWTRQWTSTSSNTDSSFRITSSTIVRRILPLIKL